jgi:hypothetical protein
MNRGKNIAPIDQGPSVGWIAARIALSVPILGVVCVAFWSAIMAAINMSDVCPLGIAVGHAPCDLSIVLCLISLLIAGLGILLLRWLGRMEAAWHRLQPALARNATQWRERLARWGWPGRIEHWRHWHPYARTRDPDGE